MRNVAVGGGHSHATVAVENIGWTICRGDFWVVAGLPNSGKSDLLATMAGMQRPLEGRLELFGVDREHCHELELTSARRRIGIVFENGGRLFTHLTVAQNVELPLCYHRNATSSEVRDRVEELLEFGGLAMSGGMLPRRLSFPLRQRLALIRALAMDPEVLLLDNPLSGLGSQEGRWWRETVARLWGGERILAGRPATIVVGSDTLAPWIENDRRFAVLRDRRLVSLGDRSQLARANDPQLSDLLGAEPIQI